MLSINTQSRFTLISNQLINKIPLYPSSPSGAERSISQMNSFIFIARDENVRAWEDENLVWNKNKFHQQSLCHVDTEVET